MYQGEENKTQQHVVELPLTLTANTNNAQPSWRRTPPCRQSAPVMAIMQGIKIQAQHLQV